MYGQVWQISTVTENADKYNYCNLPECYIRVTPSHPKNKKIKF